MSSSSVSVFETPPPMLKARPRASGMAANAASMASTRSSAQSASRTCMPSPKIVSGRRS
jgi:hypothetical protein